MIATAQPATFLTSFAVTVQGGTPPYTAAPAPAPPNPPGVLVGQGPPFVVTFSVMPSSGTVVYVDVTDSSVPPQTARTSSTRQ